MENFNNFWFLFGMLTKRSPIFLTYFAYEFHSTLSTLKNNYVLTLYTFLLFHLVKNADSCYMSAKYTHIVKTVVARCVP